MITNSHEASKEENYLNTVAGTEEKKEGVLIYHKFHEENHFSRQCKANVMKEKKSLYLRIAQEYEDKEKIEKAFIAQVRRDHQVRTSGDEHVDDDNKRK